MALAIKVENLSKAYQLGEIGTGTISRDMERWWAKKRGKEVPFLRIGETNDHAIKGVSDVVWSLKDINFEIEQGDAVGIIGRNGAGKSTLLKLLSRVTSPTTGLIKAKGRIASLLEVGTGFHPDLTGRENIYLNGAILGMRKKEILKHFDAIVSFAGLERYIDTPVKRYSSGMYVRLAFAVAAHLESEILIVDEVLAVGDAEFQKKCLGKMGEVSKGEGRTVLFVSHNMAAIKNLCNNGIVLKNGELINQSSIERSVKEYYKALSSSKEKDSLEKYNNNRIMVDEVSVMNYFQIPQTIRFDDPLLILIKGRALMPLNNVSFGVSLTTNDNIPLFTTRLIDSHEPVDLTGCNFQVIVRVNHSLRAGTYILILGIDSHNENIYYNPSVSHIEILDIGEKEYKYKNYGIVNTESTWEIDRSV